MSFHQEGMKPDWIHGAYTNIDEYAESFAKVRRVDMVRRLTVKDMLKVMRGLPEDTPITVSRDGSRAMQVAAVSAERYIDFDGSDYVVVFPYID